MYITYLLNKNTPDALGGIDLGGERIFTAIAHSQNYAVLSFELPSRSCENEKPFNDNSTNPNIISEFYVGW